MQNTHIIALAIWGPKIGCIIFYLVHLTWIMEMIMLKILINKVDDENNYLFSNKDLL